MSISAIRKNKAVWVYLAVSIFAILFNKIYAIFGHEVSSMYMTWMFLYPLIGGAGMYLLLGIRIPGLHERSGYRLFANLYNSGIALLTIGSMLEGIFKIAGTDSPFVGWYYGLGIGFIACGIIALTSTAMKYSSGK